MPDGSLYIGLAGKGQSVISDGDDDDDDGGMIDDNHDASWCFILMLKINVDVQVLW